MEIKGVRGYLCDLRIDRTTVPNSFDFWELADGDSDGTPCRYKFGILVNFFGTFITTGRLPVDDMEYGEGYINSEDEWGTGSHFLQLRFKNPPPPGLYSHQITYQTYPSKHR